MKKRGIGIFEIVTKSAEETKKAAAALAREILKKPIHTPHALVVALVGDLGSGKTTFAQGFAKGLGVKEHVLSPTFVLMRQYSLQKKIFKKFIHIDCYRLEDSKELDALGWDDLIADPKNIILIEWADRIDKRLIRLGAAFFFFLYPHSSPATAGSSQGALRNKEKRRIIAEYKHI